MKKLVIITGALCTALMANAAQVKWVTSGNLVGVTAGSVVDNGVYSPGSTDLKGNSTLTYVLSLYESGTDNLVYSASGDMKFGGTNKKTNLSWTDDAITLATTYDYVIRVTGTQSDLTARGVDGDYDYTAATITTTIEGSITTAASGFTTLNSLPSSWTVAGVTAASSSVPEPTSGLLMLVGLAGLALRRRRA